MKAKVFPGILALLVSLSLPAAGSATTIGLRGSHASMVRQHAVAKENDFTFLRTPGQIEHFVELGLLVPMPGNADYRTAGASYPYTRPATATFVKRLAAEYREACGQPLVVTSLTRPLDEQPRNASPLSVHPAGMAVDLRVPADASCRGWLEGALLGLERKGVLDVTREHHPPHLHVALFPERYLAYAAPMIRADSAAAARARAQAAARARAQAPASEPRAPRPQTAAAGLGGEHGHASPWAQLGTALFALAAAAAAVRVGRGYGRGRNGARKARAVGVSSR